LLFPYVSQVNVYRCPADPSRSGSRPRVRSYSMNSWMGSRYMDVNYRPTRYRTFVKESEIIAAGSATLWVIMDEHEVTIDDGFFLVTMDDSQPFVSSPATRHRRGYVLNFADSHVDYYKLRDAREPFQQVVYGNGAPGSDWTRLKQVTTIQ